MSTLVVGAGATGGYLGHQLAAAGRDVTFLARPASADRLTSLGLRVRATDGPRSTRVRVVGASAPGGPYDVVVLAVRADAVAAAITDLDGAVGPATRVVPLLNGLAHLDLLTAAYGRRAVLGATARMATTLLPDGTIQELTPGIALEIGDLDGTGSPDVDRVAAELTVPGITVTTRPDITTAMWAKWAFISATAVLTCIGGAEIGPVASAEGGPELARRVLAEVESVAGAEGAVLPAAAVSRLSATLTDHGSGFAPSLFRDLRAGRPVEIGVLADLALRARRHELDTPLLDSALVRVRVAAANPAPNAHGNTEGSHAHEPAPR